jgi:hypothetical protein
VHPVLAAAQRRLGPSYAGGYLSGERIIVLTTEAGAAAATPVARELGAETRVVSHSLAELEAWQQRVSAELGTHPPSSVTRWGVDVPRNTVVVGVLPDHPVPPRLQQVVEQADGAVVLEPSEPIVPLTASGG